MSRPYTPVPSAGAPPSRWLVDALNGRSKGEHNLDWSDSASISAQLRRQTIGEGFGTVQPSLATRPVLKAGDMAGDPSSGSAKAAIRAQTVPPTTNMI